MTEGGRLSVFELHKRWAKLENEHHQLEAAITQAQLGGADLALLRDRQAKLLLDIHKLVFEISEAPASTFEDYLALLDIFLEPEIDIVADIALYGTKDYPMLSRLLRILTEKTPEFEFNSLRRWLSPREYEQLMGKRRSDSCNRSLIRARRKTPKAR